MPLIKQSKYNDPRSKKRYFKGHFNKFKESLWFRTFQTHGDNLTKNVKDRFKYMGVAAKSVAYKFISKDYNGIVKSYKADFSGINVMSFLKNVSRTGNFREFGFPLPHNKYCKFLGVFKGSVPRRVDKRNYTLNKQAFDTINEEFDCLHEVHKQVYPGYYQYAQ
jgi:hypothetical protein